MSDTWGSGLSFGGADAVSAGNGNPMSGGPTVSGADVPPQITQPIPVPDTPVAQSPAGAGVTERGGLFGSGLSFPKYSQPDPQTTPLDQAADLLEQRTKRAAGIATNPLAQLFAPDQAAAAREFLPKAAEQLQTIKKQRADIAANRVQAANLGLAPGEVADEASLAARVEVAKAKALKGDLSVFKGIQAVDPKTAEAIAPQVYEVVSGHLKNAQLAFDSLAGMQNQGQYETKLAQLRKEGTLTDLEALGLKVPPSFDAFSAAKAREGQALREARVASESTRTALEARNTYQPMEKKEAETYAGRITTAYGDQISNGSWSSNVAAGTRGLVVNGAADPRDLGKKFTLASADQRKEITEAAKTATPKEDLEKFRANNRTYELATTDAKGNKLPDGQINTNPNVQQGIAEGLASMLRGGQGGANIGLLKIETGKRGYVQGLLDTIKTNFAGAVNTLSEKEIRPYLTNLTQKQQRDVLDVLHAYNSKDVGDRLEPLAERAGALGLDRTTFGLSKGEFAGPLDEALERGRQAQIERMMPNHQAIGGGDGVLQLSAQRPGVNAVQPPQGSSGATTQLPGAQPLQTPVQQSQNPQPPAPGGGSPPAATQPALSSGSPGPAGGPAAPTAPNAPQSQVIAGQTVNVPPVPGASPSFLANMQRIETRKEKDPWTAGAGNGPDGKPLSSAKGAFQAIDSTWKANKPPGAPDDPRKATPQQQIDFAANLATKNAASLQKGGLEVNDRNLYIAHNLGDTGAKSLLTANPDADARTVVGEAAARNNPLFFRGKPTVATALARYDGAMNGSLAPATAEKPAEAPGIMTRVSRMLSQGVAGGDAAKDKAIADVGTAAVEHAPAIGATFGGVMGGPAGGAVGGAGGQIVKDAIQGNEQSAARIAKEGLLGGILGVASEARPVLAAATRVGGSAAVEGGAAAVEGGNAADITEAAGKGAGLALGGEALGRFISAAGPAAHKLFSKFTPDAQAELSAQAGKLVEARKTLQTEQPKLAGEGAGPNPAYEAAKKAEEDASQYIKDHGQKPDDMAYAYEQVKGGTSAGEAMTMRKANSEKSDAGAGYDQLRSDVNDATKGQKNVKPNQSVPNGPLAQIRTAENPTGKVPEAFRPDAEHAELLVKAPAANWGEKWQQLQDAGSELIKKRMAFLADNDKPSAEAMNNIFQGVRNQQKAVAEHIFGKERGAEVITHLENLDKRYAKVMNATAGMNYQRMQQIIQGGNTPQRRELEANFKEFAKDDPSALRAFNAMKAGAQGRMGEEAKLMIPVIAGEFAANAGGIPTVGVISAAIGGHRLVSLVKEYMNAKLLGKAVTFADFAVAGLKQHQGAVGNAARTAAQNMALQ